MNNYLNIITAPTNCYVRLAVGKEAGLAATSLFPVHLLIINIIFR